MPDVDLRTEEDRRLGRRSFLVLLTGAASSLTVACTGDQLASLNLVSDREIQQASTQAWQQQLRKTPRSTDAEANARVRRVVERLVRVVPGQPRNWTVAVFEDESVNAFALPGGQIGVNTGLLDVAQTDAQLATVVGHEIGHVLAQHGRQRANAQTASNLGVTIVGVALGAAGVRGGDQLAQLLGAGATYGVILPFSREHELEADRLGVSYMADAGYDPDAALTFWKRMAEASRRQGQAPPEWASTHPSDTTRIAQLETLVVLEKARVAGQRPRQPG